MQGPALGDEPQQQLRGTAAGGRHIDMRVGAVADHRTGVPHHLRGQVGVVVEAGDDRQLLPDLRPDAAQQLALAVFVVLGHHRAVQVQIDAVDRPLRRQIL